MRKFYISFFLVFCLFVLTNELSAQRVVKVTQGVGTLNSTINGDTTAFGTRKDPDTIYELDKGGYYVTMGTIENKNYHLRIRAAAGTGKRPIIRPGVVSGGSSSRPFGPKGDLTLDGVYLTNLDEQDGIKQYVIRLSADDLKLTILNSHIDREGQIAIRCDGKNPSIIIKNSIMSNVGTMNSPSNGRGVDYRGNEIDTLIYENNTFYNLTSRIIRDGGGSVKYCRINHNTIVNSAQQGCSIGSAVEAYFTNNLFINTGFLGRDSSNLDWFSLFTDPLNQALIDQGYVQKIEIHNNNFYVSPEILAAYPVDIMPTPFFSEHTQAVINSGGWGSSNTNLPVTFTASPQMPLHVMIDYYDTTVVVKPEMDLGGGSPDYVGTQLPFDFSYPTSSPLYTASTGGQPLGDLNWFGMTVGVANEEVLPSKYELYSNYPNPFNPTTNIRYSLPAPGNVKVEIFNTLGQLIHTVVDQYQNSGTHNVVWNGMDNSGNQVSTGVYIYKLTTSNFVSAKKMMLIK